MKIAVMGAGGIGAYFGVRLAEAGEEVSFIARGAHLEAMGRDGLPADFGSSMLHDIQAGRRLELPFLSGAVTRLGAELDVPTPVHAFITAALMPHARGTPRD